MSFAIESLVCYQEYVAELCQCLSNHQYDKCQCPDRNIAPEPLIINDAYGVTIGDIITASVPYFAAHKEDILKAESWLKGDEAWHPEDDEGNIRPLPSNSQIYLTSLVPGGFMFEDVTGNGEMLAELWVQAARLAIRRKDEGYTVVAAGEVPERVIGRIDAVPMTD